MTSHRLLYPALVLALLLNILVVPGAPLFAQANCSNLSQQQYNDFKGNGTVTVRVDDARRLVVYTNGTDCTLWIQFQAMTNVETITSDPMDIAPRSTVEIPLPPLPCTHSGEQDTPLVNSTNNQPVFHESLNLRHLACEGATSSSSSSRRSSSSSSWSSSSRSSSSRSSRSSSSSSSSTLRGTLDTECLGISAPDRIRAGERFTATVTLRNEGTTTWDRDEVELRSHGSIQSHGDLPYNVAPRGIVAIPVTLTASSEEGNTTLSWQLRRGNDWFGDVCRHDISIRASLVRSSSSSSSRTAGTTSEKPIFLTLSADRHEGRPGDQVEFTITASNLTNTPLEPLTLEVRFDENSLDRRNGDGKKEGNLLRWEDGFLAPHESKEISFIGKLGNTLQHGQFIELTASVSGDHLTGRITGNLQLGILKQMPRSGGLMLKPIRIGSAGSGIPFGVLLLAVSGMGAGGLIGRRFLGI